MHTGLETDPLNNQSHFRLAQGQRLPPDPEQHLRSLAADNLDLRGVGSLKKAEHARKVPYNRAVSCLA
jgi:hypothetical protein